MELNYYNDSSSQKYPSLDDLIITNQPINDHYIYILYQQLREMKKERKQKEQETSLLTSRVNCLKQEEEKTLKLLEQIKKKTNDKIASIQSEKAKLEQRIKMKEENKREMENRRKKNKEQRLSIERGLMIKETKILNAIKEARMCKELQKSTDDYMKCMKNEEIVNKKSNNEIIKGLSLVNYVKKRAGQLEMKTKIKFDLEKKIKVELRIKEEIDKKIQHMQNIEENILRRIQETTQMHKMQMRNKKNGIKGKEEKGSINNLTSKDCRDLDQVINALIKENDILKKAFKDNSYTPMKVLNDLLEVLYLQRNQLNSLEGENDDLEQSISQLNTTIKDLEGKKAKKPENRQVPIYNKEESSSNDKFHFFTPNNCLSFTDLKYKLKPKDTPIENKSCALELSTTNLQRKTLKPIYQSQSYQ